MQTAAVSSTTCVMSSWISAGAGSRERLPHDVHELLTHVVDETAAVCNGLSRELFGYGLMAPSQHQTQS